MARIDRGDGTDIRSAVRPRRPWRRPAIRAQQSRVAVEHADDGRVRRPQSSIRAYEVDQGLGRQPRQSYRIGAGPIQRGDPRRIMGCGRLLRAEEGTRLCVIPPLERCTREYGWCGSKSGSRAVELDQAVVAFQTVPSRSRAQQRISSRRATATMAILRRDRCRLPPVKRSKRALAQGL